MDNLLNPDLGLLITTWVTFLLLAFVLWKVAWNPILSGLNQREKKIQDDLDQASKAQKDAETLRTEYESRLAETQKTIQEMVAKAKADGEATRAQILSDAKTESERILEKGKRELAGETDRLKSELQKEVTGLSLSIAEKLLRSSVDEKVQERVLNESLTELKGAK